MATAQSQRTIVLGVGGGIAAYKAGDLTRRLREHGFRVRVVMTPMAQRFVSPLTFQSLSGEPVLTDLTEVAYGHLDLARTADLMVVAPATANLLGRLAHGLCDDALTTTVVAARCPLLVCPAMNTAMWENRQVQANVALLRQDPRVSFVGPATGALADGDVGAGRLAEIHDIVQVAVGLLARSRDLAGRRVLVTAGPTREYLDPVRCLSNPSSGRMGYALAAAAARRGAEVVLISGPVELAPPPGVTRVSIETAEQLAAAALQALPGCAAVIAAAAVCDYRPRTALLHKRKKGEADEVLELVRTPDVLLALSRAAGEGPQRPVFIGFAAETCDLAEALIEAAREKLRRKGLDLVVANRVGVAGSGFEAAHNEAILVSERGAEALPLQAKIVLAEVILDRLVSRLCSGAAPVHERRGEAQADASTDPELIRGSRVGL